MKSDFGKEHDSLADMVTFGVLPSFVVYKLMADQPLEWFAFTGFLIAIFSALRLARFNIDTQQRNVFIGFPTPASALFFTGIIFTEHHKMDFLTVNEAFLPSVTILLSIAMVSPIRFIALKFEHFKWNGNQLKFVLLSGSAVIVLLWGIHAISLVVVWYILISVIGNITSKL